jgi:DNA modification methylase
MKKNKESTTTTDCFVPPPTFDIRNCDCIQGMSESVEADSVHLLVTSIPFGALFTYSGKAEDMGNCQDGVDMARSEFGLHLRFWAEQVRRVMVPGRIVAIHIQQLLATIVQHGYMGRRDFRGAVIDVMVQAGMEYVAEVSIPKNPQIIAQRLKLHSLQFKTGRERDSCRWAMAVNDFVLFFRKPGDNPIPVKCLHDAQVNPDGWVTSEEWIHWARGTWEDISEIDVLKNWNGAREEGDEKHVCPLQLEVIRRPLLLYTNPGETVMDPFMGIGSTAHVALTNGRNALGFELKESYHALALRNSQAALDGKSGARGQTSPFYPTW